jgi:hypothetical protein
MPICRGSMTLRHLLENKFRVSLRQLGHVRTGVRRHVSSGGLDKMRRLVSNEL